MDTTSTKPLAVVTGASSGIGYELARQFATNGFDLIVAAEDTAIAAAELRDLGAQVKDVRVDLATDEGVDALYAAIGTAGRPVDAVALNAGIGAGGAFATDTDLQDELKLIDLNALKTKLEGRAGRVLPDSVKAGMHRKMAEPGSGRD
jgi:short-subunit dehydrogenase